MKTAKKLLSVVLMLTMLVSTLAFLATTASAADYTFMRNIEINKQILGAYNYDNQFISLVEDPTLPGTGIRAMRMYKTGADKYGYIGFATDESSTATEFEWEPNTKYALSFDYLLGAEATIASFTIYKGAAPTYSASVAGKKEITSYSNGVSLDYKGDGKFHNAVLTFITPAADADRPHIYLRLNGSGSASTVVDTYVKNIKLVKYDYIPTAQTTGWEKFFTFDQDGNATPANGVTDTDGKYVIGSSAAAWTSNRYGDTNLTNSYFEYNEDGTLYADTHTDLTYTVGSGIGGMSFTVPKAGDAITPFVVKEGATYDISVRFKFTKSITTNTNPYSKSKIGFAYLISGTSNYSYKTTSDAYCVEPINVVTYGDTGYTEVDTWYTVSLNNWTAEHSAVLRLFIGGKGGFIIDKVTITSDNDAALTQLTVNDNGATEFHLAVKGAKLDGFNAAGVEGKKFAGWYTTATFDEGTETTTVPNADNAVIYAKYEDIEEFDMVALGSIRDEKAAADNNGVYQSAGIRFKGRVYAEFRENATELGFVAVPTEILGSLTIAEYMETADNVAISGKVMAEGMNEIIYEVATDSTGKYYDYQLIITGLTRENVQQNLLDTEITCAMYAVVNGQKVYTNVKAYSYNDVAAKMAQ
ncbi:MAG: hypothetical protein IJA41_07615 [Clostridia bacterium]|nr:hypothetical protein [Clostridia bacterium]